jgi:hypothetical protein
MADVYQPTTDAVKKTPSAGSRPDGGPMTDSELQPLVAGLIEAASSYIDTELSRNRATATEYYQGKKFGNEEDGRSQVVSTDVRDGVRAVMPGMLRVIFGPERVVEFRPRSAETVAVAEQATDFINYVFSEMNNGFLHTHSVLKDGLVKKIGAYKWGWDTSYVKCAYKVENLSQEQLEQLASDDEVELTRIVTAEDGTSTVEYTRDEKDGSLKLWALPPEEMIYNREARSVEEALFIAHRTEKTHGDLIAMGIDAKIVKEHGGPEPTLRTNPEYIARTEHVSTLGLDPPAGEANDKTSYIEGYARIDYDGDGIAELRRITTIGPGRYVVENDPVDHAPFALWCPDPEPHTITGQSWYDLLADMQLMKSALLRATLDSFSASIFPRTWYKTGDANLADVLNTAIGAPIRTQSGAGAVGTFQQDFVGREGFPILAYCDDVIERRTGQSKGAVGMDADALQSSTPGAVQAATTATQAQQELLVRIFAELTLKPLFRGMLKTMVAHSPRKQVARLRGSWVEVDPRSWDAMMDVTVNVALGAGLVEQKISTIAGIVEEMKFQFATFGLNNPFVTIKQYRDALAEIAELRGRKDASRYWQVITDQQVAQMKQAQEQAAQNPPPPSPEMMLAQAQIQLEQQKAQAKMELERATAQSNIQLEQARLARQHQLEEDKAEREHSARLADTEQKRHAMFLEDDRLRDKQASEVVLRRMEIESAHAVKINQADVDAQIEHTRTHTQAAVDIHDINTNAPTGEETA